MNFVAQYGAGIDSLNISKPSHFSVGESALTACPTTLTSKGVPMSILLRFISLCLDSFLNSRIRVSSVTISAHTDRSGIANRNVDVFVTVFLCRGRVPFI